MWCDAVKWWCYHRNEDKQLHQYVKMSTLIFAWKGFKKNSYKFVQVSLKCNRTADICSNTIILILLICFECVDYHSLHCLDMYTVLCTEHCSAYRLSWLFSSTFSGWVFWMCSRFFKFCSLHKRLCPVRVTFPHFSDIFCDTGLSADSLKYHSSHWMEGILSINDLYVWMRLPPAWSGRIPPGINTPPQRLSTLVFAVLMVNYLSSS